MKKLVLAIITALIVAVTAAPSRAASTVAQSFLLQGAGITSSLAYSGQLQCGIQVNSPANGLAATPQYSANGATWFPASSINGGSITAAGTYIDTSGASPNYTAIRLVVSGTTSQQISGQLMCGDNLPPASNGGSSGGISSLLGTAPIVANTVAGVATISDLALPKNLITNLGATCNGATHDDTAFNSVTTPTIDTPYNLTCFINENITAYPNVKVTGYGNLITTGGGFTSQKQAYTASYIQANPGTGAAGQNFFNSFNDNFSQVPYTFSVYAAGTGTGGTPAYDGSNPQKTTNNPTLSGIYGANFNKTGQNKEFVSPTLGRTSIDLFKAQVYQDGFGDDNAYDCFGDMMTPSLPTPPSTNNWPATSAAHCLQGTLQALTPNGYLDGVELHLVDNGNSTEMIGYVANIVRTVAPDPITPGPAAEGFTAQSSTGTQPIDSGFSCQGHFTICFDAAGMDVGTAAFTMSSGTNIYFNSTNPGTTSLTTVLGTTFVGFSGSALTFTVGNAPVLGLTNNFAHVQQGFEVGNGGDFNYVPAQGVIASDTSTTTGRYRFGGASATVGQLDFDGTSYNFYAPGAGSVTASINATTGVIKAPNLTLLFGSLGNVNIATGTTPSAYVAASSCGTNAQGCSGGTVTVTAPATSPGANNEYMVTINAGWGVNAAVASESVAGCVTTTATVTLVDAFPLANLSPLCTQSGGGAPTGNLIGGSVLFGDNAVAAPGLGASLVAHFIVANGTSVPLTIWASGSTSTSVTVHSGFSVRIEPY